MRSGRRGLLAMAFYMGFAAAVIEVLLIREILVICRGNELIIGMIFSSWFLGTYLGARFNPKRSDAALERRVLAAIALLPLVMALSVYGAHAARLVFPLTVGTFYSFAAEITFAMVFTAPVSFFVGFYFPPLVSLLSREMKERSGGTVFYIESMGSFAGGMAFSFLLVDRCNPLAILSGLLCAAVLIIAGNTNRKLAALAVVPLAVVFLSGMIETRIFAGVWDRTHSGKLVHYQRTRYGSVAVEASGGTVSVYGDGMLNYTLPDRYESRGLFHLVNSFREERRSMLLMGSGPGSLLHNLLAAGVERLCYFESDPDLWAATAAFRERYYPVDDNAALAVFREDLRHFLSASPERFDMIVCLPPSPENIMLNRFYTREFFSLCKKRLNERGVFITSLHGFSSYLSPERRDFIASIYRAFAGEFPSHLKTSGEVMYLVGAGPDATLPRDADALVARYGRSLPLRGEGFDREVVERYSPDELKMFFEGSHLRYFDSVMALSAAEENRDLKPGAYWKNIVLSAFRENSIVYRLIRGFVFLPAFVIIITILALLDIRRRHGADGLRRGLIICTTGFISMSVMLVLILLYQNAHGLVYYRISLINALFMMGLTLGSMFASRVRTARPPYILCAIALSIGLVAAQARFGAGAGFWAVLVVFAFLCGAVFPALFYSGAQDDYMASASLLDSMDHFGAIAGSILTVMTFLPLLGLHGTIAVNLLLVLPACAIGFVKFR